MITLEGTNFIIPGAWSFRAKPAPDRKYIGKTRIWELPNNPANRRFLVENFSRVDFRDDAWELAHSTPAIVRSSPPPVWPAKIKNHKTGEWFDLLPHQRNLLDKAWGIHNYAIFHDMGSGKTCTLLLLWQAMFDAGMVDEFWAVVPNSIIDNWHEQIAAWTPSLVGKVKVYGILSLSAGSLPAKLVKESHGRLAVAVDESQKIKTSQAKRTKVLQEVGKHAGYRHILTGTSITKGIEDLYSQYYFLDPNITGHKSFFTFRNRYCQMGGFENKKIVGYRNVQELMELLSPYTDVVMNPVKLPPMAREERKVNVSPEQKRLLDELKNQMYTEMSGSNLTVENALAYYTRGAQILGGFFPTADKQIIRLPSIPKLDELIDIIEGTDHKVVVFARFRAEQALILDSLAAYNPAAIRANDPELQNEVNRFQTDPACRVIVATYAMGSVGFTLTAGRLLVKYSGTFNYEDEAQSEKRIHRIGQEFETMTIRLSAKSKLDSAMKAAADGKKSIADFVNDNLRNPRALLTLLDYE